MQTTITPLREPDLERSPQPPANVEAEQALLGAILINNAAHGRVAEFLLPEHFGNAVHGRIYAVISRLIERGQQKLFELATAGEAEGGPQPFARALTSAITMAEAAFKRDGKTVGVATNFVDLDKKLGGLHPSDLIILAGRPSMGKTSLATNIAFGAAKAYRSTRGPDGRLIVEDGAVVGFFSLEMSTEQLATRILAEESGVSSDRIRRGEVRREDFDKLVAASHRLASVPLYIDDTPALSVGALRTRARRLKRQQGLGLIIIDHIQLLRPSAQSRSFENRVQELSDITRGLKALAK